MGLVNALKNIPIDLGQGSHRFVTKGKIIAQELLPIDGQQKTLLDFGCREGHQSQYFIKHNYRVTSIDIEKLYSEAKIVDGNMPLPFDDSTFDYIWCSEVIEHLVDPCFSLNEMRRVIRHEGKIVITTPNSFAFYFCLLAAVGLTPQKIQRKDHIHFFDHSRSKVLFPEAKFYGYLPFSYFRPCITRGVGTLSPTFIIEEIVRKN